VPNGWHTIVAALVEFTSILPLPSLQRKVNETPSCLFPCLQGVADALPGMAITCATICPLPPFPCASHAAPQIRGHGQCLSGMLIFFCGVCRIVSGGKQREGRWRRNAGKHGTCNANAIIAIACTKNTPQCKMQCEPHYHYPHKTCLQNGQKASTDCYAVVAHQTRHLSRALMLTTDTGVLALPYKSSSNCPPPPLALLSQKFQLRFIHTFHLALIHHNSAHCKSS
jgi:hypothetical protein